MTRQQAIERARVFANRDDHSLVLVDMEPYPTTVKMEEDGAWVQAWIWVDNPEGGKHDGE